MVMSMIFEKEFVRPDSGIGHPIMNATLGAYPRQDRWLPIATSPYQTLVGVLANDEPSRFDDPRPLFGAMAETG